MKKRVDPVLQKIRTEDRRSGMAQRYKTRPQFKETTPNSVVFEFVLGGGGAARRGGKERNTHAPHNFRGVVVFSLRKQDTHDG